MQNIQSIQMWMISSVQVGDQRGVVCHRLTQKLHVDIGYGTGVRGAVDPPIRADTTFIRAIASHLFD